MKYNRKTIFDYVSCNDIEGYTLEELENDSDFMIDVIKYTHDKNMIGLCSDKVKRDPKFLNFIVDTFNKDYDFILNITKPYLLDKENNSEESVKLLAKVCELIPYEKNNNIAGLKSLLFTTYLIDREITKNIIDSSTDDYIKGLGKGFLILEEHYDYNETILNYYAKNLINDIFEEEEINLETYLHNHFKTFEEIEEYGINKFLLNFISYYDPHLSEYITFRLELLDNLKSELNHIKMRWSYYIRNNENNKWELLLERLKNYIEINKKYVSYESELFYITCLNYDLFKDFTSKNMTPIEIFNYISKDIYNENIMNFAEKKEYYKIKNIFITTLSMQTVANDYIDLELFNNEVKNNKILKFKRK